MGVVDHGDVAFDRSPSVTSPGQLEHPLEELAERIRTRDARAAVVGLGYVGLPLLVSVARAGFRVIGFDTDRERVSALEEGRSYVADVSESDLGLIEDGEFSSEPERLVDAGHGLGELPGLLRGRHRDPSGVQHVEELVDHLALVPQQGGLRDLERGGQPPEGPDRGQHVPVLVAGQPRLGDAASNLELGLTQPGLESGVPESLPQRCVQRDPPPPGVGPGEPNPSTALGAGLGDDLRPLT